MILNICNKPYDTDTINDITITASSVLIDAKDDFYRIRYTSETQIEDAIRWKRFKNLTKAELREAISLITMTCDFFINTKEQCKGCPLKKKDQCVLTMIPLEWRT